jgi:hypothetical protein
MLTTTRGSLIGINAFAAAFGPYMQLGELAALLDNEQTNAQGLIDLGGCLVDRDQARESLNDLIDLNGRHATFQDSVADDTDVVAELDDDDDLDDEEVSEDEDDDSDWEEVSDEEDDDDLSDIDDDDDDDLSWDDDEDEDDDWDDDDDEDWSDEDDEELGSAIDGPNA